MAFATAIYVDKVNYLNMIKEKLVKKHSPFMSNGSTIQITTKLWFTPVYQQRMYHLPTEATGRRLRPMLKNINPFLAKKCTIFAKKEVSAKLKVGQ